MGLKKNQSAITHVAVTFAEIDAFYDVTAVQRAACDRDGNRILYNTKISKGALSDGAFALFTDDGSLYSGVAAEMPSVYRYIRLTEAPYFVWQTFDRKRSTLLDNKYVYVWVAEQKDGTGIHLQHELYFNGGSFQFLKLNPEDRTAQGGSQSQLLLELISFQDATPKRLYYFFYLSPFQLPWDQLNVMKKDVPARAMRLWDVFYTDVYRSDDPSSAVSVDQVLRAGPASLPPHMTYRVHLLDPFKEAVRRSVLFKHALKQWQDLQQRLGSDDEYLLAKRLEAFTAPPGSEFYSDIGPRMNAYLDQKENDSSRLYMLAILTAGDLIRWIGAKHQREKYRDKADTWFSDGRCRVPSLQDNGADSWHNAFCQSSLDFFQSDAPVRSEVEKIVNFVHEQLDDTPVGEKWMEAVLKRGVEGHLEPLESGASEYLFQTVRKGEDAALKGVGWLLKTWAAVWVKHYRKQALSTLRNWMESVHGIALEEATLSQRMSGVRRLGWARKNVDKLTIEPTGLEKLHKAEHVSDKTLGLLHAALEAINLCYAIHNASEHRDDPWAYLEAIAAAADCYHAFEEVKAVPEVVSKVKYGDEFIEIPVFAAIAGTVDTVLAAKDLITSDNLGEQVANGLRTVGAGCSVVGVATSEELVGLLVWAVGMGLQSAGSYMRTQFSPAHVFLRHCRWGEVGFFEGFGDAIKDQDSFWYQGDLRKLSGDIAAQHRCLDEFIYHFEPEFVFEAGQSVVIGASLGVRMKMARGVVGPQAKWQIEVTVERQFGETFAFTGSGDSGSDSTLAQFKPMVTSSTPAPSSSALRATFTPSDDFGDVDITAGKEFLVKAWSRADSNDPILDRAEGDIVASVIARLDVFGDSKHVIVRKNLNKVFDLASKVRAEAAAAQE